MTAAVWQMPTLKRGRHAASQGPTHADWLATIATGWWVQRDPEDGPIFCRWVPVGMERARNMGDWWQVLLGPDDWSGVWLVRAGQRSKAFRLTSAPMEMGWQPQAHFGKGNLIPVRDWQAYVTRHLSRILIREGLCTATEWDRYTGDRRTREQAAQNCRPMIWM